jgi:tripartite-type tricarboxylate transporter receptor subunit TctC
MKSTTTRLRRRTMRALAGAATLALLLAACGGDDEPAVEPAEEPTDAQPAEEGDEAEEEPAAEGLPGREPQGPIELALGTGVGGTPDVVMRAALQCLRTDGITDIDVVVQNRTGASWAVMYDFLSEQVGSESVIGGIAQPIVTTPPTQGIDYWHPNLTPIALLLAKDVGVVVRTDSQWETLEEFLEYAEENPGAIRWGGSQIGATSHITMSQLANAAGVDITYVPYESGGEAETAFLAGDVDAIQQNPDEVWPLIESGDARMLAILADERLVAPDFPELEEIPTTAELGTGSQLPPVHGRDRPAGHARGRRRVVGRGVPRARRG